MTTTRRHPRTLQEAFGPYTSCDIYEPPRRRLGVILPVLLALAAYVASVIWG